VGGRPPRARNPKKRSGHIIPNLQVGLNSRIRRWGKNLTLSSPTRCPKKIKRVDAPRKGANEVVSPQVFGLLETI